jgi:hypothetical protein
VRLNLAGVKKTLNDLQSRLDGRKKELQAMRQVQNGTPVILGGAFVIPAGLLRGRRGEGPALSAADAAARKRIETLAMRTVIKAEEAKGHRVVDVSAQKCGWDLSSYPPNSNHPKHIEIKGRVKGADIITVSRNEILYAFNQTEKFVLAIVLVGEDDRVEGPFYIRQPFDREPGWGVASINYDLSHLLAQSEASP